MPADPPAPTADRVPNAFAFTPVTDAERSTVTASETVAPSGFDTSIDLSVPAGMEYSLNGAAWASVDTLFPPGTTLRVRLTSSASYSTAVSKSASLGGVLAAFSVTTRAPPAVPPNTVSTAAEIATAIAGGATTVNLANANYGHLALSDVSGVTITGGVGAVFRTISLARCTNVTLDGFTVDWTARDGDTAKTVIIRMDRCTNCAVNIDITGHVVPEGTLNAKHTTDVPTPTLNSFLVGFYAGVAVSLANCAGVNFDECNITGVFQGITYGGGNSGGRVRKCVIEGIRTTPIKGYCPGLSITKNRLGNFSPYRYTDAFGVSQGDHLDFIHMFINATFAAMGNVTISDNLLDAGAGFTAIGMLMEDNSSGKVGFPNLLIDRNTFIGTDTQAVSLGSPTTTATLTRNVILTPPAGTKFGTFIKRDATIVVLADNTLYDATTAAEKMAMRWPSNTFNTRTPANSAAITAARDAALALIAA